MKHTQEQLEAMSDLEINRLVADRMGGYAGDVGDWMPEGVKVNCEGGFFYEERDYCNNPSDIMPIAIENKISLHFMRADNRVQAFHSMPLNQPSIYHHDLNPYRAIAIVYLLMKQNEVEPEVLINAAKALKGDKKDEL